MGRSSVFDIHQVLFGTTPRESWIPVEGALGAEIEARLAALDHVTLADWAGVENLEERVDGIEAIDPVVLAALREAV